MILWQRVKGPLDENGHFLILDVPPGDYRAKLTQKFDERLNIEDVEHETQLVVLGESQSGQQKRFLGVRTSQQEP